MRSGQDALVLMARAGMEIAWRYAWACFLTLAAAHRPFPLAEAVGAFAMAAFLTRLTLGTNWRVYQTLLLQLAGFVLFALFIEYRISYARFPFFDLTWVGNLLREPRNLSQWFILVLILFGLFLIWRGGRKLVKDPNDYFPVCLQFDKGLGLFLLLLLIQFLVEKKAGILIEDRALGFLVFAFFIFSLIAIGLARNRCDFSTSFLAGYRGVGIILSFTVVMLMFGSGLTLLFYPYLTNIADSLRNGLKIVAEPMVPVIVKILSFVILPGTIRSQIAGGSVGLSTPAVGGWTAFLLKGIGLGLMVVIGLMAIGVLAFIMKYILQWLLKRQTNDGNLPISAFRLLKWLKRLIRIPLRLWNACVHLLTGFDSAAMVYRGLLGWGRRSGLPLIPTETPSEYGSRVMQHFPQLKAEIEMIVGAFNQEVYGQFASDRKILTRILSARRRMRSPRYWPLRMRVWFFS